MDDVTAEGVGIPPVDATKLQDERAAGFKDQVQAAILKRLHEGAFLAIKRVELLEGRPVKGLVAAHLFGASDREEQKPEMILQGYTPEQLAYDVYYWLGGRGTRP